MRSLFTLLVCLSFFQKLPAETYGTIEKAIIDVNPIKKSDKKPSEYIKNDSTFKLMYYEGEGAFPVISSANRPDVAEKINLMLQFSHLSQIPGKYKKDDPFIISNNNFECGQTIFWGYSVSYVSPNILKIEIEIEQVNCTGVGLANHTLTEHYDLLTGNKIEFEDLFTKRSIEAIKLQVIAAFKTKFDEFIKKIKTEIKVKKLNKYDRDRLKDQLELYSKCKEYSTVSDFSFEVNYAFQSKGIKFWRRYCWGNESERSIDDYSTPNFFIKYADLITKMSDYGKYILGYSQKPTFSANLKDKILKGNIGGKYPIKAVLQGHNNDSTFHVVYWYDRIGIPIKMYGELEKDGILTLVADPYSDTEEQNIPQETIRVTMTNKKLEGIWENLKTNQKLKFILEPY